VIVAGNIGVPPGSFFARIGPDPVIYALMGVYVVVLLSGFAVRSPRQARGPSIPQDDKA
jgi:hypothetical protein